MPFEPNRSRTSRRQLHASRRRFLKSTAAAGVGLLVGGPASSGAVTKRKPANERLTVGVVGVGSRGFNLLGDFGKQPDTQIVAICDVCDLHYRDRPWGKGRAFGREPAKAFVEERYAGAKKSGKFRGVETCSDYRELCQRADIDVVVVATPDHWHALACLEALAHGKDVYGEKPITHTFAEGVRLCDEVARREAIFQTGSQQRSEAVFRKAVELIRNGHLGKVHEVQVGLPPGYDVPQDSTEVGPPPEGCDYEMWCGPAPKLPYMRARHHRWWRGHSAFGGGVLMDWIGHHNDINHWALGVDRTGPRSIEAVGWVFPETKVYDTPWHYEVRCEYPGGTVSSISDRHAIGTRWAGENGWIYVRRGKLEASNPEWLASDFPVGDWRLPPIVGHARDFLDGVRERRECVAPADAAHRSITPGHVGYVSHKLGRKLAWDPVKQEVPGDAEANELLRRTSYRAPWELAAARK